MEKKQGTILTKANEQIIRNLEERQTFFENEMIAERPYIIGEMSSKIFVRSDNFIRIMLYEKKGIVDPRWVGEDYFPPHTKLKVDAKGVDIDWYYMPIERVYPAEEIEGLLPYQPPILRELNIEYANDLLNSYFALREDDLGSWGITFEKRMEKAIENMVNLHEIDRETNVLDREVLTYLFKVECGIGTSAKINHAHQIAALLRKDKNLIFQSFERAEKDIEKLISANTRQLERRIKKATKSKTEPFHGLNVYFRRSEATINHPVTGKPFKEESLLHGEEAYLFLVELNRLDKEIVNKDTSALYKTMFSFEYGSFKNEEIRVDLGDMAFQNCTLIADGMRKPLSCLAKSMLCHENRLKMIEQQKYLKRRIESEDELLAWADSKLKEVSFVFGKFEVEEMIYQYDHPEIGKINQEKAETRLYHAPFANKNEDIVNHWLYNSIKAPISYGVDDTGRIIETGRRIFPQQLKELHLRPFYTPKEIEKLKELDELQLNLNGGDSKMGKQSMTMLYYFVQRDKREYELMASVRKHSFFSSQKLHVKFRAFERTKDITIGKLVLGNQTSITDTLRYIGGSLTEAEKNALDQLEQLEKLWYKYRPYAELKELRHTATVIPDLIIYPAVSKPEKGAPYQQVTAYYKQFAELNNQKGSLPFMVEAMQKDGRTKQQIIYALETGGVKEAREKVNQILPKHQKKKKTVR